MSHFSSVPLKAKTLNQIKQTLDSLNIDYINNYTSEEVHMHIAIKQIENTESWGDCEPIFGWFENYDGELFFIGDLWKIREDKTSFELVQKINNKFAIDEVLKQAEQTKGLQNANVKVTTNV